MRKLVLIWLIGNFWLSGCSLKDTPDPNENIDALHERFHGRYKPVSAVANESVDVNLDGKSSSDMFQEYSYLEQHYLELNIYGPNQHHSEAVYLFTQWWPEQYVSLGFSKQWNGEPLAYEPSYSANFAQQGGTRQFSFSTDLKQIFVKLNETEHPFRWHRPDAVVVEANDYIQVVNTRRLFTPTGVKDVKITTLYKRYQTTT